MRNLFPFNFKIGVLDGLKDTFSNIGHSIGNAVDSFKQSTVYRDVAGTIHNILHPIQAISSGVAGVVAKCIAAFFVSTSIGKWLTTHTAAMTVFCLGGASKDELNDPDYLSKVLNQHPLNFIFPNGYADKFTAVINSLQEIFASLSIAVFLFALIGGVMLLSKSAIFNNPYDRQEFFDRVARFFVAWGFLAFLPQIVTLMIQFNGIIVMTFQHIMMALSCGTGKGATNMWTLALSMGGTLKGMSDALSKYQGFAFTFLFYLINICISLWVYCYYLWRAASFAILYLLAYIQIPSYALSERHAGFEHWFRAMFSTIFIQSINAFVITLMAMFWEIAYEQLHFSFDHVMTDFGVMILLGVILLMFQPLSSAIARQLDLDTSMADSLTDFSSSAAKDIGVGALEMKAIKYRMAVGAGAAAGGAILGAATGDTGLAKKGLGKLKSEAQHSVNNIDNSIKRVQNAARNARNARTSAMSDREPTKSNGLGGIVGDIGNDIAGTMQALGNHDDDNQHRDFGSGGDNDLTDKDNPRSPRNPRNPNNPLGLNNAQRYEQNPNNPLEALKGTEAGGVINNRMMNDYGPHRDWGLLGFSSLNDFLHQHDLENDIRQAAQGVQANQVDANARRAGFNPLVQGTEAHNRISSATAHDEQQAKAVPRDQNIGVNNLRAWADNLTASPAFANNPPTPNIHQNPIAHRAYQAKYSELQAANPQTTPQEAEAAYVSEASSPAAFRNAMDSAIASTLGGNVLFGNAPYDATMQVFQDNLRNLGYSPSQINRILGASPLHTTPKSGDIGRNTTTANNPTPQVGVGGLNVAPASSHEAGQNANPAMPSEAIQSQLRAMGERDTQAFAPYFGSGSQGNSPLDHGATPSAGVAGQPTGGRPVTGGNGNSATPQGPTVPGSPNMPTPGGPLPGTPANGGTAMAPGNNPVMAGMSPIGTAINANSIYPQTSNIAPSYMAPKDLAHNLMRSSNGGYDPQALQAHVTNSGSYIQAQMNDGTSRIISNFGQGDPALRAGQEYVRPLNFNPNYQVGNSLQPAITPASDNGTLLNAHGGSQVVTGANPYINQLLSHYNGGASYGNVASSIPPVNSMVDQGNYTMQALDTNPDLSQFRLVGDQSMSYIAAWDKGLNDGQGGLVRISPTMKGVSDLKPGLTFESPLTYANDHFSLRDGSVQFDNHSGATHNDYHDVNQWLDQVDFRRYIRPTQLNRMNYAKNHQGNLNLNMNDFMA